MTALVACVVAYLLGGLPTADWLAARAGVDLRGSGSGNPGANNALRVAGARLAIPVLTTEVAKGVVSVVAGAAIGGTSGMVGAGIGAVLGNVANPYRRLRGGQGLGITAGVLAAALPVAAVTGVVTTALVVAVVRRSAPAAVAGLAAIGATAAALPASPWGIETASAAIVLAAGITVIVIPKQWAKLRRRSHPPRR